MSRKAGRIALGVLLALIAIFATARLRYSGRPPVELPAASCNADLWKHVYQAERLKVIEACTQVEGRVVSVHRARDGDLHIGLDPDRKSVLNLINVMHAQRNLIVEAICDHPSNQSEATAACEGFSSLITAPSVGDRVRVTGAYVTDRDNNWNEVHPVSRIDSIQ